MGYEIEGEVIRRYLLGQLTEDERQQLEERIMVDTELFNRVLLAEDEMVEEYVQGELSESERAGFETSFLSTPDGRQQVSFAKALSEYVKEASPAQQGPVPAQEGSIAKDRVAEGPVAKDPVSAEPPRDINVSPLVWWRRPYFRLATAAVVVLGLGLGIYRVVRHQSDLSQGLAALNDAYHQQRPVEPRISGFEYAPTSVTRGGAQKVETESLSRAERILRDEAAEHPSATSHHALGRLYLAEQKFDDAIREFDEALKANPNNAQFHSDYGAALLEKGKTVRGDESRNPEEFDQSLRHLNDAIALDGSLLEALFNRALCYQELKQLSQAEEDWRAYLEKDRNSKWADEARNNLRLLTKPESKRPG